MSQTAPQKSGCFKMQGSTGQKKPSGSTVILIIQRDYTKLVFFFFHLNRAYERIHFTHLDTEIQKSFCTGRSHCLWSYVPSLRGRKVLNKWKSLVPQSREGCLEPPLRLDITGAAIQATLRFSSNKTHGTLKQPLLVLRFKGSSLVLAFS